MIISRIIKGFFKTLFFIITLIIAGVLSAYITMHLIIGGGETKVPNLIGKSVKDAVEVLSKYDLNIAISKTKKYDDKIPANYIAVQNPPAGSIIKKGRKIEVILSGGTEKIEIPSLIGMKERESLILIQQLDLAIGNISSIFDKNLPTGIISQYPKAGSKVFRGTLVDLLVNKGEEEVYFMPDLIGKNMEAVINFFNKNNIRIGSLKVEEYPGIASKTVIKQYPEIGYPIKPMMTVNLTISK